MSEVNAKMEAEAIVTDIWDGWDRLAAERAEADARGAERERQALAQLLAARGHRAAAAVVAISEWRTDLVDNWNGGQYTAVLAVPPAYYDLVEGDIREQLTAAASAVVGESFVGFDLELRLSDVEHGWDEALLGWLRDQHQGGGRDTPSAQPVVHELPAGTVDGH